MLKYAIAYDPDLGLVLGLVEEVRKLADEDGRAYTETDLLILACEAGDLEHRDGLTLRDGILHRFQKLGPALKTYQLYTGAVNTFICNPERGVYRLESYSNQSAPEYPFAEGEVNDWGQAIELAPFMAVTFWAFSTRNVTIHARRLEHKYAEFRAEYPAPR